MAVAYDPWRLLEGDVRHMTVAVSGLEARFDLTEEAAGAAQGGGRAAGGERMLALLSDRDMAREGGSHLLSRRTHCRISDLLI